MHKNLAAQYHCDCEDCKRLNLSNGTKKNNFKDVIKIAEKAFKKLYHERKYSPKDLGKIQEYRDLVQTTAESLSTAIPHEVPTELKNYLEKDVFIFSGLKTHAQLSEARSLLKDELGNIRPYYQFEQEVLQLNPKYNQLYLEAEYQFAIQSGQSASNWAGLQNDTNRYWLEYRTAGDNRVRDSHDKLRGTVLPKDDAFWSEYYPPNAWRCRCTAVEVLAKDYTLSDSLKALKEGEKATTQINQTGKNKLEMFRFNPGKDKKVFPPNNAYTKVVGAKQVVQEMAKEIMKTKK